jgi:hypothetical protein
MRFIYILIFSLFFYNIQATQPLNNTQLTVDPDYIRNHLCSNCRSILQTVIQFCKWDVLYEMVGLSKGCGHQM